jgi:hypothetical protein
MKIDYEKSVDCSGDSAEVLDRIADYFVQKNYAIHAKTADSLHFKQSRLPMHTWDPLVVISQVIFNASYDKVNVQAELTTSNKRRKNIFLFFAIVPMIICLFPIFDLMGNKLTGTNLMFVFVLMLPLLLSPIFFFLGFKWRNNLAKKTLDLVINNAIEMAK